ncbi:hypothetical protein TUM20985_27860 [Mycobacterium antarcticum]|nr:hypothetical protein TUM20985_27860 [Mycolicibacterium sp. TUM20985]GLP84204.1 hypothetical protein TUM20984_56240 [Mycolicibacterium sp. TUM20984]
MHWITAMKFSDELTAWATQAGYAVSQGAGTLELWSNPGGEQRFYVRQPTGGVDWWALASSDRGSAERYELSAHAISVLERYLFALLGDVIRARMLVPDIRVPNEPHSLPAIY